MPMLDAYIPEGALGAAAEEKLMATLTDTLLRWEGADPADPRARSIAWVFLHRPATVYVAGEKAGDDQPRYRIVASVPEGQLDDKRRRGMVAEITTHVLDAEPEGRDRDPMRVWVFAGQIPEGSWGGGGRVVGLADIATFVLGDAEAGRAHAARRLAITKAERDAVFG
jgi:phenylpyruvate tautomerase PptA (4-oxalocrotonate tautomerase family)